MLSALTTLLLALPSPQAAGDAGLPSGLPAPTLPASEEVLQDFADGMDLEFLGERGFWHALAPHPSLRGGEGWDRSRARAELGRWMSGQLGWDEDRTAGWLAATGAAPVTVEFRLAHGEQRLMGGSRPIHPGQPVTLGHTVGRRVVGDLDVEIAQQADIGSPTMRVHFGGASLGLAVHPVPGRGWWTELALTASLLEDFEEIDLGSDALAGKGRDASRLVEFSGPVLLRPGVWERVTLPGPEVDDRLTLELRVQQQPGPGFVEADGLLVVDLPTLALDPGLAGTLDSPPASVRWASPVGMLVVDAQGGRNWVDELLRTVAEVPVLDTRLERGSADGEASPLLHLRALGGADYRFAAGRAQDVLVDWDAEVAQTSRAGDPLFARPLSGVQGSFGVHSRAGGSVSSELHVRWTRVLLDGMHQVRLAGARPAGENGFALPAIDAHLDRVDVIRVDFDWEGPLGSVELSQDLPPELGRGETMQLRLRASRAE